MSKQEQNNLAIWQQVEKTDPQYTKQFSRGGGFRGTATNATYLAKKATATFGPMGIGWGVEILDEELMTGAAIINDGEILGHELIHKVRVKVWYRQGAERGEVVQFGQTQFVGRNKNGLYTDEEAPKKSLTDGMSKCLSLLGFSADIHLGRYDDNKYVEEVAQEFAAKAEAEKRASAPRITADQHTLLTDLITESGTDLAKFLKFFKVARLSDLPAGDFDRAERMLEKKKQESAA
jgi:hypothetical protein